MRGSEEGITVLHAHTYTLTQSVPPKQKNHKQNTYWAFLEIEHMEYLKKKL